jgi:hypothetical protein
MVDLSDIRFVKRISVGTSNPGHVLAEEEIQEAVNLLNRCLSGPPKGTIIGIEKSFRVLTMGEHQALLQWIVYHVGFSRKPSWLDG